MSWRQRVFRRPRAEWDITEQFDYYLLEVGSPALAELFLEGIEAALETLVARPEIGVQCEGRFAGYRRWPVPGFERHLMFYHPIETGIELVRVLHGARDREAL